MVNNDHAKAFGAGLDKELAEVEEKSPAVIISEDVTAVYTTNDDVL